MIDMIVATLWQSSWHDCVRSWIDNADGLLAMKFIAGETVMHAYEEGRAASANAILGYVHDDVMIYENGWDSRVLHEFVDPAVAIVGFGGALGHGHPSLYKGEYHLPNLARQWFMSNMRNAQQHGECFSGVRDVSVLDGFALFIRRSFLNEVGGWPQDGTIGYFMYSEWACCMARRLGYRIRLVGVDCEHLGGKSSGLKPDQAFDYEGEHAFIYNEFRDVLPAMVGR